MKQEQDNDGVRVRACVRACVSAYVYAAVMGLQPIYSYPNQLQEKECVW